MAVSRNPGLDGLRYRGGGYMVTWMLHRISGVSMILFVSLHVVAAYLLTQYGSGVGRAINTVYESWLFQAYIFFCIIFHTLNGARVITLDLWPRLMQYQREAIWLEWLIFIPVYGLSLLMLVQQGLAG